VAIFGLCSRVVPESRLEGARPEAVVPDHAEQILDGLAESIAPATVSLRLRATAHRSAAVTRTQRAGSLLVPVGALASLVVAPLVGLLLSSIVLSGTPTGQLFNSAAALRQQESGGASVTRLTDEERQAHERIVAGLYERLKKNKAMPRLPQRGIDQYEALLARYPNVSDAELNAALALVESRKSRPDETKFAFGMVAELMRLAAFVAIVLIGLSSLLRAPVLRMAGLSVKKSDGARATRWQHLVRAAIAAAPLLPFLVRWWPRPDVPLWLLGATWTGLLVGVAIAMVKPSRGIPDLVAGTQLVPR